MAHDQLLHEPVVRPSDDTHEKQDHAKLQGEQLASVLGLETPEALPQASRALGCSIQNGVDPLPMFAELRAVLHTPFDGKLQVALLHAFVKW